MNTSTKRGVLAAAGTVSLLAGVIGARAGHAGGQLPASRALGSAAAPAPPTSTGTPTVAPPAAPAQGTSGTGTFRGSAVDVGYGTVQVQVTTVAGRLTDVKALQLPSGRSRSRSISSTAAPILRGEALAAQSANIQGVSGATYTSQGYAQSLQSALAAARP